MGLGNRKRKRIEMRGIRLGLDEKKGNELKKKKRKYVGLVLGQNNININ